MHPPVPFATPLGFAAFLELSCALFLSVVLSFLNPLASVMSATSCISSGL